MFDSKFKFKIVNEIHEALSLMNFKILILSYSRHNYKEDQMNAYLYKAG